jgi:hypothetical protein
MQFSEHEREASATVAPMCLHTNTRPLFFLSSSFMRRVIIASLRQSHRAFGTSSYAMSEARFHTFDVSSQVFLEKKHTLGIVNLKPIVPLHVLIIPRKKHKRLGDVPPEELKELFENVQHVSSKVQELIGATACTVSIQDGADAVSQRRGEVRRRRYPYSSFLLFTLKGPISTSPTRSYSTT